MTINFPQNPRDTQTFKSPTDCLYRYYKEKKSWIFVRGGGGDGAGATVFVQESVPDPLQSFVGSLWVKLPSYFLYVYYDNAWIGLTNNAENQTVVFSGETPPSSAEVNSLWYDTNNSDLRILYKDEDSTQWVTISSSDMSNVIIGQSMDALQSEVSSLSLRVSNIENIPRLIIE